MSFSSRNQTAATLSSDVMKASASAEGIVREGSWLNCVSLSNPSYSLLLKPTRTAFLGVNGRCLLGFLQDQLSPDPTDERGAEEPG